MANKDNPLKGKQFQHIIRELLSVEFNIDFKEEVAFPIGIPSKLHKFDCVSSDNHYVVECKCYSWTKGNNSPSAKFSTLNEAVLYFSFLPKDTVKILAMKKDVQPNRKLSLAQHYVNTNYELLSNIKILEYDDITQTYSWVYPQNYLLVIEDSSEKSIIMYNVDEQTYILSSIKNGKITECSFQVVEDAVIRIHKSLMKQENISYVDQSIKALIESQV